MELSRVRRAPPGGPRVGSVTESTKQALEQICEGDKIKPGDSIAITAGSRGLPHYREIIGEVVRWVRGKGGDPFLVPAMGSHGGGTVKGRLDILAHLGITPESTGAPIIDGEDVIKAGQAGSLPLYADSRAAAADGIIMVNRIKPHTAFHGSYESGLIKMLVVGLGKVPGATIFHEQPVETLSRSLADLGRLALERLPVIGGIALVENSDEEVAVLEGIPRDRIMEREPILLQHACSLMPRLPFTGADILVIDEMGKNFSGTGLDTNVIGRFSVTGDYDLAGQPAKRIFVRALSAASEGNANGVGVADFITKRLEQAIDRKATYLNALTTGYLKRVMLPLVFDTDREALQAAAQSLKKSLEECSLGWIPNTLHLNEILVTPDLLASCRENGYSEVERQALRFDADGNMVSPW
ncbi:MAG: DUF2088 domain-containing protein [Bacillota bacterium]